MSNKFIKQLKICLDIIDINIYRHLEIINKEEEESQCEYPMKDKLIECSNLVKGISKKYEDIQYKISDADRVIKEIYNLFKIQNNQNKDLPKFSYQYEKSKLPNGMLDSYMSFVSGISYIQKYLMLTTDRESITNEINKIENYIKEYSQFVEKELILNVY